LRPKLLADESFEGRIVAELRARGYEVGYVAETNSGSTDPEVLELAVKTGSVILTNDLDFGELAVRFGLPHCGILIVRLEGVPTEVKAKKLIELLGTSNKELQGKLTILTRERIRIRKIFPDRGNGHQIS